MIQEFVQQIENTIRESTYDIHTTLPGTVVAFDPESGMATVKPEGTVAMKNLYTYFHIFIFYND